MELHRLQSARAAALRPRGRDRAGAVVAHAGTGALLRAGRRHALAGGGLVLRRALATAARAPAALLDRAAVAGGRRLPRLSRDGLGRVGGMARAAQRRATRLDVAARRRVGRIPGAGRLQSALSGRRPSGRAGAGALPRARALFGALRAGWLPAGRTGLDGAGQYPASRLALARDRGGLDRGGVALRGGADAVRRCDRAARLHRSAPRDGPSGRGHAAGGSGERRAGGPVSQHVAGALRSGGSDRDPPNLRRGADARVGRLG